MAAHIGAVFIVNRLLTSSFLGSYIITLSTINELRRHRTNSMILYRLITFDVTGTLLKLRMSSGEKYAQVAAHFGLKVDHNVLTFNFKSHFRDMCLEHPNFGLYTGIGWKKWWTTVVFKTFEPKTGKNLPKVDEDILAAIAEKLIEDYKTSECWEVADGSVGLLSRLKESGVHLGVISNFDSRLEIVLASTNLLQYFDFIVTSYAAGFEKPDANIFNIALQNAGETLQPSQALHVGNNPEKDFRGARNAGWSAVIINSNPQITVDFPDLNNFVFSSLCHLNKWLTNPSA